jgi:hypothetical protein
MKRLLPLFCALIAVAVHAPSAAAQMPVTGLVRMQLDSAVVLMRQTSFTQEGPFRGGALADGGVATVQIDFRAGRSYIVMAVCDGDCEDLDLELHDPAGDLVDSDFELDDVPMVATETTAAGRYSVVVSMASCSVNPCAYGLAVFSGTP